VFLAAPGVRGGAGTSGGIDRVISPLPPHLSPYWHLAGRAKRSAGAFWGRADFQPEP